MRTKKGIISSNKQDKTVVVTVHSYKNHPKYKKRYRLSKKYHVHNPDNKKLEIGQEVIIKETIPVSKLKRWELVEATGKIKDKMDTSFDENIPVVREKHHPEMPEKKEEKAEKGEEDEKKESAEEKKDESTKETEETK